MVFHRPQIYSFFWTDWAGRMQPTYIILYAKKCYLSTYLLYVVKIGLGKEHVRVDLCRLQLLVA